MKKKKSDFLSVNRTKIVKPLWYKGVLFFLQLFLKKEVSSNRKKIKNVIKKHLQFYHNKVRLI